MTSGKAPRPKTDAQMGFDLLMELYEKGQTLDTKSQVELVNKFLAVREPGRQAQSTSPTWSRSKTGSSGISSMAGLPGLDPANPRHLFFTRVFELLTEVAPWLRVCQREGCRRLFLFQRPKQIYCSDSCAQ